MTTTSNETQNQLNALLADNDNLITSTSLASPSYSPQALALKSNSFGGFVPSAPNTPAIIGSPTSAAVLEDNRLIAGQLVARGFISLIDPDKGQSSFLLNVQSQSGNLGTLNLSADGSYVYSVNNNLDRVQQLGANETHVDSFLITSTDGTSKVVQFTIYGANDAAIIGVPTMASVTENADSLATYLVATGSISIHDADLGQSSLRTSVISAVSNFGTLILSSDGNYTYSVDQSLGKVQQLREGDVHVDRFLVTAFDGTTKIVEFSIHGSNEAAKIGEPNVTDVTEDTNVVGGLLTAKGAISISDVDNGQAGFLTKVLTDADNWGSLVLTSNGTYSYSINNSLASVQQLGANDTHTDRFTISAMDGTTKTISFTVHGANDSAVIGLPSIVDVTEDLNVVGSRLSANGSISVTDIDQNQAALLTPVVSGVGNLGTLVLAPNGAYTYSVDNSLSGIQQLGAGEMRVDHFTVVSLDGSTKNIDFYIHGSNDLAIIGAPSVSTVKEDTLVFDNTLTATGVIAISDADQNQAGFQTTVIAHPDNLGHLTLSTNGVYTYAVDNSNLAVQKLGAADSHTDHFTISSTDGTTKIVDFTIIGTNDAAIISAPSVSFVKEDVNVSGAQLIATGLISITDIDQTSPSLLTDVVADVSNLGVLSLSSDGRYSYTVSNDLPAVQQMREGDTHVDHFVVKSNDGTSKMFDFTIFGTNDGAIIGAQASATLTEDNNVNNHMLIATGSLSISDVDQGQGVFLTTVTSQSGNLGTLVLSSHGDYTYSVDNTLAAVQHLELGDSHIDHFTVTALDGTTKVLDFTINGVNESYQIGAPSVSSVYEDQNVVSDLLTISGTISVTDSNLNPASLLTTVSPGADTLGTLIVAKDGSYTYSVDNTLASVQKLGAGDTHVDYFTVTAADNTTKVIEFVIHGTNDSAVISGQDTASLTQSDVMLTASGMLSVSDIDTSEFFVPQTDIAGSNGFGKFSIRAEGLWTYKTDTSHREFVDGVIYTDSITVTTADGTSKVISVHILGTNNAAVITGSHTASLTESNQILTAAGQLTATDVDSSAAFVAQTGVEGSSGYGKFSIDGTGSWTYTADSVHREFVDGVTYTDSITVATEDGTNQVISVSILGTNNAAVISGSHTASLTESNQILTAAGELSATDVDSSAAFIAQTGVEGSNGYGKFSIDAHGSWTYTADSAHSEFVDGVTYTDSITVATADGTTQVISVHILGTNNAAVITGSHTASLIESNQILTAAGQLTATDVDSSAAFVAQTGVAGSNGFGKFSIDATGSWSYATDSVHREFVDGVTYTDSITVATADGTTQVISVNILGVNNAAVISGSHTASLIESNQILTTAGQLNATDVDSSAAFVAQTGVAGSNGFGKFSIDATGAWSYTAASAHSEFVDGVTYTDSITVATADGTTQVISVNILGVNNAAVISGSHTASLTESNQLLTATGQLSAEDVDSSAAFVAQIGIAGSNGYGKFSIDATGVWTYTTDNVHREFVEGVTYTDNITVATVDGTSEVISVNILGTNNAAVISGSHTSFLSESSQILTAAGQLSAMDIDSSNDFVTQTGVAGSNGYGQFSIDATGAWTYTADSVHREFVDGVTYTDSITVATADGTSQVISVSILGTNNAAVISGSHTASLTESNQLLTATGQLSAEDVDSSAAFVAQIGIAGSNGYGKFSIDATGVWTYTTDNVHREFVDGVTYTDSITVATADGTSQVISVDILGVNNAAVISGSHTASLTESNQILTAAGQLTATDVDSSNAFVAQTGVMGSNGYGQFSIDATGSWTYTADSVHSEFVDGLTYTDSITVATADGTSQVISVNILGVNNAAVISGSRTASLTESNQILTAAGQLTATDVDSSAAFVAQTGVAGSNGYGKFSIDATGSWSYTADSAHSEFIDGVTYTDSITVATTDGTSQVMTVNILGTNNSANITGTSTVDLTESNDILTATGQLSATDIDSSSAFIAQNDVQGSNSYGKFSINTTGAWSYTADSVHREFVDGVIYTDSMTVKTADGTPQLITVRMMGVNNAAVITGTHTASLTESDHILSATGLLSAVDIDGSNAFIPQSEVKGQNGYGRFSIDETGSWSYVTDSAHDEFVDGTTYTDNIVVSTVDGTLQSLTVNIEGTNDAASIGAPTLNLVTEDDVLNTASFAQNQTLTVSGSVSIHDPDTDQSRFNTSVQSDGSNLGSLTLSSDGSYVYGVDNRLASVQELGENDSHVDHFTIQSIDGTTRTVDFTIQGKNDAAIIGVATVDSVTEDDAVVSDVLTATGVISISDTDRGQAVFQTIVKSEAGNLGMLVLASDGTYTYSVDNTLAAVQALGADDSHIDHFTVMAADGTTKTIDFTIYGKNDTAVIGDPTFNTVSEDSVDAQGLLVATGSISVRDVDQGQAGFQTEIISADGNLGKLSIDAQGKYSYIVDNTLEAVQQLGAKDTYIDYFTVQALDGTTKDIEFVIHGTNDSATIETPSSTSVTEDNSDLENNLTVSGSIELRDPDQNEGQFLTTVGSVQSNLGVLVIDSFGNYVYTVDNRQTGVQQLGSEDLHTDHFVITSVDGTSRTIDFTIHGTQDAAIIGDPSIAFVTEDHTDFSGKLVARGTIAISDADQNQSSLRTEVLSAESNLGTLTIEANGQYTYSVDNRLTAVQQLGAGDVHIDYFTISALDETTKVVEFAIRGTQDAAVIDEPSNRVVTEDTNVHSGLITASGTIVVTDIDLGQANFLTSLVADKANLGQLVIDTQGNYVYTVDNNLDAVQQLGALETHTDLFTVTSSDGTTKVVSFTIQGSQDLAVIGTPSVSSVTEDVDVTEIGLSAVGTISISDTDQGQARFVSTVASAQGNLGTLTLESDGHYVYRVDNNLTPVQLLESGQTHVDYFTVSTVDGTSKVVAFSIHGTHDSAAPIAITGISQDTGIEGDLLTSATTITVSGTNGLLRPDQRIQISTDEMNWFDVSGNHGTWSYMDPAIHTDGLVNYKVRVIDLAGNIENTASQEVQIDTIAPTIHFTLPVSGDGYLNSTESDHALVLTGTAIGAEGQIATIHFGGKDYYSTVSDGVFSVSIASNDLKAMSEGTVNITADVSDLAGNQAIQTFASYVYDKTVPTIALTSPLSTDGYINNAESDSPLIISGVATGAEGQSVTVHLGNKDYASIVEGGLFRVSVSPSDLKALSEGVIIITAQVSDAAGNTASQASASYVYDKTAPSIELATPISTDGYINDTESNTSLVISGTASGAEGQIATIHLGGKDYTSVVDSGKFSVTVPSDDLHALSEGTVSITAHISDVAGNAAIQATTSYVYDKTAPTIEIATPISSDGYVNGTESNTFLVISGTASGAEGQMASVHLGGKDYTSVVEAGKFSVTVSSDDLNTLNEGMVNITANVSDRAGNAATPATASYFFDKTAPTIAISTPLSTDGYVNGAESQTPLTISGTATGAEGQIATVHLGGKDYTSTVSGGDFSVTVSSSDLKALNEGTINITANVSDVAGNAATQATASLIYDKTAPTVAINTPISTDGYVNNAESGTSLIISGIATGAEGQIATVHIGNKDYTSTVSSGSFSVSVSSSDLNALSEGSVSITANVSDRAGNAAAQATASYLYDKTAPTIAINTPISIDGYLNSTESDSSLIISGSAIGADGQLVTVHLGGKDYTTTVSGGAFSVSVSSADLKALSEGPVNITANVSDVAGNAALQATASYLYDKTAPTIALSAPISSDGYLNSTESNSALLISGTASGADGQVATVHLGGKDYTSIVSGGVFSVSISSADLKSLNEGIVNITATISDVAGNAATQATASYVYDKTAPMIAISTPISSDGYVNGAESNASLVISGTATGAEGQLATIHLGGKDYTSIVSSGLFNVSVSSSDLKALSEGVVNITANVSDVAGNAANQATASYLYDKTAPTIAITTPVSIDGYVNDIESNASLIISGTATGADGQLATVHLGGKNYTSTVSAGAFSASVSSAELRALSEGTVNITASVSDAAGNAASLATASYVYDKTAPLALATVTALSSDSNITGDFVTNIANQTLSGTYTGTLGAGEKIQISADNISWTDVTANAGTWSTASNAITLTGTGTYHVRSIDAAGNVTTGTGHNYVLDTLAPTATVALTGMATDSGLSGDFITNDTTLTLSGTNGTLDPNEKIQISTDGLSWHDVTVTANTWGYVDPTVHVNGAIDYQVRVLDLAGNIGNIANHGVIIDTIAPTLTIMSPISSDGYLNNTEANSALTIVGTATGVDGQSVTVHLGSKDYTSLVTAGNYSVNVSSADLKTLGEGVVNITANVSDVAGNAASQANASFIYDKTAPTLSITTPISTDGYLNNSEANASLNIAGTATGADGQSVALHLGTKDYTSIIASGAFNVTVASADLKLLSEGTVNMTANVSDLAGNTASQATASFIFDKTAPTATPIMTALSSDSGTVGDFVTNVATQTISGTYSGTLGSGEKIQVSADSINWVNTTASAGTWSTAANAITLVGSGTYSVRSIDTAGNTTAGTGHSFILDTIAPNLTSVSASQTTLNQTAGITATLTFTFSEAVYGLSTTDFAPLSYGNLTNLTQVTSNPHQWTALYTDTKTQNSVTTEIINIKTSGTTLGHDLANNLIGTTGNTGTTLSVGKAPIALDLDGDGIIQYLDQSAGITYDYAHSGQPVATSWVGPKDGFLAIQQADHSLNIVFATQAGETDLQGLARMYDTNHDNILSALDAEFQHFGVWQDASSNGKVDSGEFITLSQAGITSIALISNNAASTAASGEVLISGQSVFTKADGTTGRVDDASLMTGVIASQGVNSDHAEVVPNKTVATSVEAIAKTTVNQDTNATVTFADLLAGPTVASSVTAPNSAPVELAAPVYVCNVPVISVEEAVHALA